MTKKLIIYFTVAIVFLIGVIAAGVAYLYAGISIPGKAREAIQEVHRPKISEPEPVRPSSQSVSEVQQPDNQTAPVEELEEIFISGGPFNVTNCASGKQNTLARSSDGQLSLTDENGQVLWTLPMPDSICGIVSEVDFYANGKIQFLFGTGCEVHLLSRTGSEVKSFPIKLDREILIGPAAYDFNKNGKYHMIVLHKDNSVEMYDLQGKKPDSWLGIRPGERITALPEKLDKDGKTFWAVRTDGHTLVYPFYGGEPVQTLDADVLVENIVL